MGIKGRSKTGPFLPVRPCYVFCGVIREQQITSSCPRKWQQSSSRQLLVSSAWDDEETAMMHLWIILARSLHLFGRQVPPPPSLSLSASLICRLLLPLAIGCEGNYHHLGDGNLCGPGWANPGEEALVVRGSHANPVSPSRDINTAHT